MSSRDLEQPCRFSHGQKCPPLPTAERSGNALTSPFPPGSNLLPKIEGSAKGPEKQLQEKGRHGSESKAPRDRHTPVVHVPAPLFSDFHCFQSCPFSTSVCPSRLKRLSPQGSLCVHPVGSINFTILQILIMYQICAKHPAGQ